MEGVTGGAGRFENQLVLEQENRLAIKHRHRGKNPCVPRHSRKNRTEINDRIETIEPTLARGGAILPAATNVVLVDEVLVLENARGLRGHFRHFRAVKNLTHDQKTVRVVLLNRALRLKRVGAGIGRRVHAIIK